MQFAAWIRGESPIMIAHVTKDDLSILLSSFRETIQSIPAHTDLVKKIGLGYLELSRATSRLRVLVEEASISGGLSADAIRFGVSRQDVISVERSVMDLPRPPQPLPGSGEFLFATTLDTLEVSLRCAKQMISYLWPEEVFAITGYSLPEILRFEHELEACVNSARMSSDT